MMRNGGGAEKRHKKRNENGGGSRMEKRITERWIERGRHNFLVKLNTKMLS